ncbi:hypothetical protein [Roseobacter sp. N2S]|uniref:hypothetical protein n=1 Tax=Roseobacter sp. N2S TaxID=2663844 RepID=UPI002864748A|nr:hypothetical protein [Roseobacter sp. N2S]MDR6263263.1 hypothetical protein [Roseobacter sp. N2S]
MIEKLVFHIGDPKNGSSSIQSVLAERLWTCESRTLAPPPQKNAVSLANSLKADSTEQLRANLFGEVAQWAAQSDANYGVISSEFFSRMDPSKLQKALKEYLPDHVETARTIVYVRPYAERFVSTYAQRVKAGAFNEGLPQLLQLMKKGKTLKYYPLFSEWRAVFGDNFTLRPFLRSAMKNEDVVADFFHHVLEGAPFTLQKPELANQALYVKELAGMRAFQSVLIKQDIPRNLRAVVGGIIGRAIAQRPDRSGTKLALDRATAQDLADSFAKDAAKIDAAFFDDPLFQPALDAAVENALADPQSTQPKDHFPPDTIKEIRALAQQVSAQIKENPKMWRTTSKMMRGTIDQETFAAEQDASPPTDKTAADYAAEVARLIA